MIRSLPVVAQGDASGPFGANVSPPCPVGQRWEVLRAVVKVPNWTKGVIVAVVMVDGNDFVASQQGQNDTASGDGFRVYASQTLRVEWRPMPGTTFTGPVMLARANIDVDQVPNR